MAGALAYATSLDGVFVFDDVRGVVRNATIRTLWPLTTPLAPPPRCTVSGRPIANLSLAINCAFVSGAVAAPPEQAASQNLDPVAFHVGNLLIHLAAALALFGVVRRTLERPRLRGIFGDAALWVAASIALLWVVHPLTTAAVTYVVQRVESLMALFYLLTLYCAIRADEPAHRWRWTGAAVACCAAGMATKEAMVSAPLAVAAWDWCFSDRGPRGAGRIRWYLAGGLAATWAILVALVLVEHRAPSIDLAPPMVWTYLTTQAGVIVHYLQLAAWPMPLAFMYDWPLAPSLGAVAWQAALMLALVAVVCLGIAKRHPAAFPGAVFFLVLAPSSSVLPIITEVAAEHRMYLPLAALVALVVPGVFALFRTPLQDSRPVRAGAAVAVIVVVAALGSMTRSRNEVYATAVGLWADTVRVRPSDSRPRVLYAEALIASGRLADAAAQLREAIRLSPALAEAHVRLGMVLAEQHKFAEAILEVERAVRLAPDDLEARRVLSRLREVESASRRFGPIRR